MSSQRAPRNTLDRRRILAHARHLLDQCGLDALTMRALADSLGVRPMALYHHVSTKDQLLDALVDSVFAEVYLPNAAREWRHELAERSRSMRTVLGLHPWALTLIETRKQPGVSSLTQHEAVLETLRSSGFSIRAAAHGYAVLDAFVYGFALQEMMLSTTGLEDNASEIAMGMDLSASPRIAELAQLYIDADAQSFGNSFEVGLDIVLNGLALIRDQLREPGNR